MYVYRILQIVRGGKVSRMDKVLQIRGMGKIGRGAGVGDKTGRRELGDHVMYGICCLASSYSYSLHYKCMVDSRLFDSISYNYMACHTCIPSAAARRQGCAIRL